MLDGVRETASTLEASGLTVEYGGQVFQQVEFGITIVEGLGVLFAALVLVVTFGSLLAAGLPLLTALVALGGSMGAVLAAAAFTTISTATPMLALMIGLAVGIDYALFIVSRHRKQLADGMDPEESAATAVATAGSSVVFAGLTVVIALVGLLIVGIPFLGLMGVAAALAVVLAMARRDHAAAGDVRPARAPAHPEARVVGAARAAAAAAAAAEPTCRDRGSGCREAREEDARRALGRPGAEGADRRRARGRRRARHARDPGLPALARAARRRLAGRGVDRPHRLRHDLRRVRPRPQRPARARDRHHPDHRRARRPRGHRRPHRRTRRRRGGQRRHPEPDRRHRRHPGDPGDRSIRSEDRRARRDASATSRPSSKPSTAPRSPSPARPRSRSTSRRDSTAPCCRSAWSSSASRSCC